jgi:UDPglucose 6-dehydrogenase
MKISVVGTGYVGLVSGVCLAEKGHDVVCVDIDRAKVDSINSGKPPIYERNLESLLQSNINRNFSATVDLRTAVLNSDITLIAVGTPYVGDEIDLSYIRKSAQQIGEALREKSTYHVVVVKSTVVPGTTEDVVLPIVQEHSGKCAGSDFGVGMNPEFLREGEAIDDFMNPDRIVIGGIDERTLATMAEMYSVFPETDIVKTTPKTAEMIKYAANSLLATLISFSNEIGNLCSALGGIDVVDVMRGVHLDKRVTPIMPDSTRVIPGLTTYLAAGCGFGGSCFPKDVRALIAHGKKHGFDMQILDSVMHVNELQPLRVIRLLKNYFSSFDGKTFAVVGLAFKPGTDDMRESPAIPIVNQLLAEGASLKAYDPVARDEAMKLFGNHNIRYPETLEETIRDADAVILLTKWEEFNRLPEMIAPLDVQPVFIDGRRFLDKSHFTRYAGIGL